MGAIPSRPCKLVAEAEEGDGALTCEVVRAGGDPIGAAMTAATWASLSSAGRSASSAEELSTRSWDSTAAASSSRDGPADRAKL